MSDDEEWGFDITTKTYDDVRGMLHIIRREMKKLPRSDQRGGTPQTAATETNGDTNRT